MTLETALECSVPVHSDLVQRDKSFGALLAHHRHPLNNKLSIRTKRPWGLQVVMAQPYGTSRLFSKALHSFGQVGSLECKFEL
jgi:hypothetical protein